MFEVVLLLVLVVVVALWLENRRVQEIAVARCRQACKTAGMQFLDDVAPNWGWRLTRDVRGTLRLRRIFTFEYSTPLGERRRGSLVMLGRTPVALELEGQIVFDSRSGRSDWPA